jgi:hypothetical protein
VSSDFCVITSYFNPARYKTKRRNFDAFMENMAKVNADVRVIELAFGDDDFELKPSEQVLQFRGNDVMWQKERLLNVAAASLPDSCTKVGWFEADLIFKEPDWLERTSEALDRYMVVQPFSHAVRMNRGNQDDGTGLLYESFASCFVRDPSLSRTRKFNNHGHTGFAWAARREFVAECGFYDACLTASGDHLMAHAFAASIAKSPCMPHMIGPSQPYAQHFVRWAIKARDFVGGKLGVVPGRILHLWHGDYGDRRYAEMNRIFMTFGFDPDAHIRVGSDGLWEWSGAPERMRQWARDMFEVRNEDGERPSVPNPVAAAAPRNPAPRAAAMPRAR